jgi:hypothetical protein
MKIAAISASKARWRKIGGVGSENGENEAAYLLAAYRRNLENHAAKA